MASLLPTQPVKLDGRTLEGGGQLLRIALALSALTGMAVEIHDIRGKRSGGSGLKAQHLACVEWLANACEAKVTGAQKKSKQLLFEPGRRHSHLSPAYKPCGSGLEAGYESKIDIGSAGSTGLVLQAVLPYVLCAPPPCTRRKYVELQVTGGTNVSGSPSFEYLTQVLFPTLETIGLPKISAKLEKRGWSQGNVTPGSFILRIPINTNSHLAAFSVCPQDRSTKPVKPRRLQVTFLGPATVHEHLKTVLIPAIRYHFGEDYKEGVNLVIDCEDSENEKRLYLVAVAIVSGTQGQAEYRLGRDWLYDRKVRSTERAVTEMCERVAANLYDEWKSGAWVDEHMRDQLVIFQALAKGSSSIWHGRDKDKEPREPSLHAQTAEWVASQMLGAKFGTEGISNGIGFEIRQSADGPPTEELAGLKIA